MGDVITRFRLETSQFDSKLRDASKELAGVARAASMAGDDFGEMSRESIAAAKAFGGIATSAATTKDKVKELVAAFNDVAKVYNNLSAEQQQSDFGRALASSMQTLQGRIADAKAEMMSTGGVLGQLKEKLTLNIDAIKLFNIGLTAAKGALSVAKDAFFASEQNLDDWNRTVYSAQSTYEGFLTAINTGDISGFLTRIDDIVRSANEAYNAMDALSTQKAINNPAVQAQQAENQRLRTMLMTKRWVSAPGTDSMGMKDGQMLTDAQMRVIERKLESGMKTLTGYTEKEVKATTKAIEALYDEQANRLGMTKGQFMAGVKDYDTFARNLEGAKRYQDWELAHTMTVNGTMGGMSVGGGANPYAAYKAWGVFKDDGELFKTINQYINQRAGLQSQMYSQQGQAYRTINRVEGISHRIGGGGGGAGGGGVQMVEGGVANLGAMSTEVEGTTRSMRDLQAALKYFQDMLANATTTDQYNAATAGINSTKAQIAVQPKALKYGLSTEMMAEVEKSMNDAIEDMQKNLKPLEIKVVGKDLEKVGEKTEDAWNKAASAVASVGSALQNINDPGAKVASIIAEAIANIALGMAKASSQDWKLGTWGWIASAAAGVATMVSTIASIKSATAGSYEEGGIVPGNSYHGDHLTAAVNSGELILSAVQQDTLASLLVNGGSGGGGSSRPYVSGEQIYLGVNNYLRRSGRGEIVTTR